MGSDVAFAQVEDKLVEHYGILLPESTIRRVTEAHAQAIYLTTPVDETWTDAVGCRTVIVEMDGGMVPIVEADAAQTDRRKGKTLQWKEAKLCLAHAAGSQTLSYGGTLQGDVEEAGKQLFASAKKAGLGKTTQVHAVGDGAEWIARQVEERSGSQSATGWAMTVDRDFKGDSTPCGMKFTTLAGSVGGGNQTPGFVGHSKHYIGSKKFLRAEGGIKRLVWMPKHLKEELREKINEQGKLLGVEDLADRIADETVGMTQEEIHALFEGKKTSCPGHGVYDLIT